VNSAWWQWGAWEGKPFDEWLKKAISLSEWYPYCKSLSLHQEIDYVYIKTISNDVVKKFLSLLNVEINKGENSYSNKSLPEQALRTYQSYPFLRSTPHSASIDFATINALRLSNYVYPETPWVLNPDHVKQIIDQTRESNLALLELLDESERDAVLNDRHWWDEAAYALKVVSPPVEITQSPYHRLCADLLNSNHRLMRILAHAGLLGEFDKT
jgi:hypothetical protein